MNLLQKQIGPQVEQHGNYICFSDGTMLNISFKINKVNPCGNKIYIYYQENLTRDSCVTPSFETPEETNQALVELRQILTSF
jgi:hypothetical protein